MGGAGSSDCKLVLELGVVGIGVYCQDANHIATQFRKPQQEDKDAGDSEPFVSERLEGDVSRKPWTLTHGFYAVMGRFTTDTTAQEIVRQHHLPESRIRLDIKRFYSLLENRNSQDQRYRHTSRSQPPGTQPDDERPAPLSQTDLTRALDISKEEILDKSNASGLAKSLVCLQSTWFCIQCLARLAQHLPLSLLEMNTAVHVVAALTVYLFWWQKPLDIEQPTALMVDGGENARLWAWSIIPGCFPCLGKKQPSPLSRELRSQSALELIQLVRASECVDFDKLTLPKFDMSFLWG